VEVYWIHPQTRAGSLMTTPNILNGALFTLNSFIGHEFEARELPSEKTGHCKSEDKICNKANFVVSANADQAVTLNKGLEVEFMDDQIRAYAEASDLVKSCQEKAKTRLGDAAGNNADAMATIEELTSCVESGVAKTIARSNEEIAFQAKIRRDLGAKMENYTCVDPDLNTTDPVDSTFWMGAADRKKRSVDIMLDRPASRIHLIKNFVSPEECDAMADAAARKLHRATVADGKGGHQFSEHRKAMQAAIKVAWSKEKDGDAIARLSRRVYDYNNHVLELNIDEHGQEDLMSIQYVGRGENDTTPDRYTPHCDGECLGMPFKTGTRMATVVMYCTTPERGGHTNFRNAAVHVKPEIGSATYFSYIDPATKLTDNGFTEHSGCPVFEGEKKIVTQWIRYGVDDENPWNSYNTLGIKEGKGAEEDEDKASEEL
jgi:hypothetical protein